MNWKLTMRNAPHWVVLLTLVGSTTLSQAAEQCRTIDIERPSIGLVLGGGGARGSAHIGVLKVLEEMQVPVDYIVGTSMGALIGALYATGMTAGELEARIVEIDWDDMFKDQSNREIQPFRRKRDDTLGLYGPKFGLGQRSSVISAGAVSGQKISFFFESTISERVLSTDFDALPIPYRAVAADILTGDEVVIDDGSLSQAMRASMSVPGVFDPVPWGDRLLVDGGVVNNVPVDVVRAMGADIVIAVQVGSGLLDREQIKNALNVMSQLFNLMIAKNVERQLATLTDEDILLSPPLGNKFSSSAFKRSAEGIEIGYQSADAIRSRLSALSITEDRYRAHRALIENCANPAPAMQFVRIENTSRFSDEVLRKKLSAKPGQPLDVAQLDADLKDIYSLGFLELARYEIVEENGAPGLVIHVTEDSRGTDLIEWGLDVFGDGGDGAVNLRLGYLKTNIDQYGSEFRVVGQAGRDLGIYSEMYKYLGPNLDWFVLPRVYAEQLSFTEYVGDDAISAFDTKQYGGSMALGYEINHHAALSAGLNLYRGHAETVIGEPDRIDDEYRGGEYFGNFTYDRLDDRYLPRYGNLVYSTYVISDSSLGADVDYQQILFGALSAHTFGRHTLWGGLRLLDTVNGEAPAYDQFFGGGFLRLSGFHDRQLLGQSSGVLMGSYQYQVSDSRLLPVRVGFSVEYGQVADSMSAVFDDPLFHGSLFMGYRTPIGPMFVGYGMGEGGENRFFLRIGDVFGGQSISR